MPRRDRDWMLTGGMWTEFIVPSGVQSLVPLASFLSQELSASVVAPAWYESGDSFVLERILGTIYVVHQDMTPGATYQAHVHVGVDMLDTDVAGVPVAPGAYDWEDPLTLNRAILYHRMVLGYNLSTFWTDRPGYGQFNRLDIDIKSKRRVETNRVPCLVIQNTLSPNGGRVAIWTNLRLLGSKSA